MPPIGSTKPWCRCSPATAANVAAPAPLVGAVGEQHGVGQTCRDGHAGEVNREVARAVVERRRVPRVESEESAHHGVDTATAECLARDESVEWRLVDAGVVEGATRGIQGEVLRRHPSRTARWRDSDPDDGRAGSRVARAVHRRSSSLDRRSLAPTGLAGGSAGSVRLATWWSGA